MPSPLQNPLPKDRSALRLTYREKLCEQAAACGDDYVKARANTSTPGNPAWSSRTGASTPSGVIKPMPPFKNPFVVGNDAADRTVEGSWQRKFKPPLNDEDYATVKYIFGLLARLEPQPGTADAQSIAALTVMLEAPTIKEEIQAKADGAKAAALGSGLVTLVSQDLRDALGILPTGGDQAVKTKIAQNAGSLTPAQTTALWATVINMISRTTGSAISAAGRAKSLFPKLLALVRPDFVNAAK